MKTFTISAALETGQYTPNTIVNHLSWLNAFRLAYYRYIRITSGALTVSGVIIKSSNVGSQNCIYHFRKKLCRASLIVLVLVSVLQ
ncbi:penicillin-binding transpeptidase domain-containing protein [Acinetobacter baumannii]